MTDSLPMVLLTGGQGQIGSELLARPATAFELVAPPRQDLDLGDPDSIDRWVSSRPWAAVINAAAYTAVDKAQSDVAAAWRANAMGPALLAAATAAAGAPLIQISTDYVFDGSKPDPYGEDDPIRPVSVYGASKAAGELAVQTANPRHVILRTAWVVSPHGSNFVKTMLRLAGERPALSVVDDQVGCPTSAADIAAAVAAIVERHIDRPDAPTGVFHFVNAGEASWCGFARHIVETAAAEGGPRPDVVAIATRDYPTPARRPANSRLSCDKIGRAFGIVPRPWREATAEVVQTLVRASRPEMAP